MRQNLDNGYIKEANRDFNTLMQRTAPLGRELIQTLRSQVLTDMDRPVLVEMLRNQSINFDLNIASSAKGSILRIKIKNGLAPGLKIKKPEMFLKFCAIHGLIPILNTVRINGADVSDSQNLNKLFELFKYHIKSFNEFPIAVHMMMREVMQELEQSGLKDYDFAHFFELLALIQQIRDISSRELVNTFGHRLQKKLNNSTVYENVFMEIFYRIEDEIKKLLGYDTTFVEWATFHEDTREKTDAKWLFAKDTKSLSGPIPIQLKIGGTWDDDPNIYFDEEQGCFSDGKKLIDIDYDPLEHKLKDIEAFLKENLFNNNKNLFPFIVMRVDGDFATNVKNGTLRQDYSQWIHSPKLREMYRKGNHFPFFIDSAGKEKISSAVINVLAMHMITHLIQGNYRFSDEHKDFQGTLYSMQAITGPKGFIEGVDLSKIWVRCCKITKLGYEKMPFYRLDVDIKYDNMQVGKIVIYRK